jgi:hypothetical protein
LENERPSEQGDMGDKMARHVEPFTTPSLDGMAEMQGAPI